MGGNRLSYKDSFPETQHFFDLVKKNGENTNIRQLKIDKDNILIDSKEILSYIKDFYSKLYSKRDTEQPKEWIKILHDKKLIPQISEEDIRQLNRDISKEEIEKVQKSFQNNKAPGSDGLTHEFYSHFWVDIVEFLMASYEESMKEGELSTLQRQNMIRLIPKKDKDRLELKNWRPLNLIEYDTKLIAKVYAWRMIEVLGKIIHIDQTAYVRGRFIGEGIRTIEGVIEFLKSNELEGYLLSVDFEKAFDSLDWEFLWESMRAFGFPNDFIDKIKILYTKIEARVINNGTTTDAFEIARGTMQGFPIAGFLFIVAVELLFIKLRNEEEIQGIRIGQK